MSRANRLFVGAIAAIIIGFAVMAYLAGPMGARRAGARDQYLGADGFPIEGPAAIRPNLPPEIQRWRAELQATGKVLEDEHSALDAEQTDLDRLGEQIESRRRQYKEQGFSPAARADDQLDVMNYNHRLRLLRERVASYNSRLAAYRQAVSEYDAHLRQSGLAPRQ